MTSGAIPVGIGPQARERSTALALPPQALLAEWPSLLTLTTEYASLQAQLGEANESLSTLQRARNIAKEEDRNAFADALRAGQEEPKRRETEVAKQLEATARRIEALTLAVNGLRAQTLTLISSKAGEWMAELDAKIDVAQDAYVEAVRQVQVTRLAWHALRGLRNWLAEPSRFRSGGSGHIDLLGRNSEPYSFETVFATLLSDATPARPAQRITNGVPMPRPDFEGQGRPNDNG